MLVSKRISFFDCIFKLVADSELTIVLIAVPGYVFVGVLFGDEMLLL